jgi:hypothetical protein
LGGDNYFPLDLLENIKLTFALIKIIDVGKTSKARQKKYI